MADGEKSVWSKSCLKWSTYVLENIVSQFFFWEIDLADYWRRRKFKFDFLETIPIYNLQFIDSVNSHSYLSENVCISQVNFKSIFLKRCLASEQTTSDFV